MQKMVWTVKDLEGIAYKEWLNRLNSPFRVKRWQRGEWCGYKIMPYNKSQREELLLAHTAQLSCETPSLRILLVTKIDIVPKKVD